MFHLHILIPAGIDRGPRGRPRDTSREHRGLTLEEMAKASRPMIATIEARNKRGGIATLKKLAGALGADLDHLA